MANIKRANTSGITKSGVAIPDVPDAPTIGAATNVGTSRAYNNGSATVAFTASATGGTPTSYTATSTPGSFTATGAGSPLTVTGLQSATSYTFAVTATNTTATGAASAASSSITATTVPNAPTIGTPTNASGQSYTGSASVSVPFTALTSPGTGGSTVTGYTVTSSSGATGTGSSTPISVTETVGNPTTTARTYTITATNANGTGSASSASSSVVPASVPQTPTISSATRGSNTTVSIAFSGDTGGSALTAVTITSSPSVSLSYSGTSSPITVTGTFVQGTSYTFSMTTTNANGTTASSGSSNSVTPFAATAPSAPTIGTVTRTSNTVVSVPYTDGSANGSAITSRTITSSPSISLSYTNTSASPIAVTGSFVQGTAYTFSITTTNGVGTSSASSASNSVTPYPQPTLGAFSAATAYPTVVAVYARNIGAGALSSNIVWAGTGYRGDNFSSLGTGYYWNGSNWTQQDYYNASYVGMGRVSTTQFLGASGYTDLDPGNQTRSVYYGTGTSAFTNGTSYPLNAPSVGLAKISDGVMFVGGQGLAATRDVYYQTTIGGSFTLRSGAFPIIAPSNIGVDIGFSTGYWVVNQVTSVYSLTSVTGAFSVAATLAASKNGAPASVLANINDTIFYAGNDGSTSNTYLFNGSTFTASTASPINSDSMSAGSRGSVLSITRQTVHYTATLS